MYLLPVPQTLRMEEGLFSLKLDTKIVLDWELGTLARTGAKQLQDELRVSCGLTADILSGEGRKGDIFLTVCAAEPAQGYTLSISADGVTLKGNDEAGLLNAVQTLRQIIMQNGWELPALTIEDAPCFPNRGFYHDITRGRTPTMETLKWWADQACLYKINQLQLYVEHTYLFRDITEMWRAGQPLTAQQIMELDDYCAERGVELVPSLSSFGHLCELLRTKSYCDLCELEDARETPSTMPHRMAHHTLNPIDPRSLELAKKMIAEFMPLFRSRQFNLCADETFDLGKGRSKEAMEKLGESQLYIGFVKELAEFIVSKGRRPMFWGDIVVRFADAVKVLPEGTICLNWAYHPTVTEDSARILAEAGAVQYMCPGVGGWNQLMNLLHSSYENISRMAKHGKKYNAIGLLNTDWGDYGHVNDPRFSLPGFIYGAHFGWSNVELSFGEINEAISNLTYTDRSGRVVCTLAAAAGNDVFTWHAIVRHKDQAQGVLNTLFWDGKDAFEHCDESRVKEANANLDNVIAELRKCCLTMDTSARSMMECWQLAIEGMKVWNLVGAAVKAGKKDAALAEKLERWYYLYERMWRSVSQESELWRIRDVMGWYADQLR
ncbi:MAG: family 20 glycosylhydrolase [Clostridia bacterium]|nr:family 20 glycosylhydrolase [Clostridia bacterium]